MKIEREDLFIDENGNVCTPTEPTLKEKLITYKNILSNETYDYLTSLLNLEVSALANNINEEERNMLFELSIYRKLVFYNIYNRINDLLEDNKEFGNLIICDEFDRLKAQAKIDDKKIDIFNFNYLRFKHGDYYDTNEINLYLTKDNKELREQETLRLIDEYEYESNKKNPYSHSGKLGGGWSTWEMDHDRKLYRLNTKFKELDQRKTLTDIDKKTIEVQEYYYNLLLGKYGLGISKDDFKDVEVDTFDYDAMKEIKENPMNKKKVKKYPDLNVYSNIKNL